MAKLFKNKYRTDSMRARFWDYSRDGAYFITICVHDRQCVFGEVVNGEMVLSEIGKIAHWCWEQIPNQFSYGSLDVFVVMPNHVHGIVVIGGRDAINRVSTATNTIPNTTNTTPPGTGGITGHHNPMLHENLGRIIRWYKGRVTFESRKVHADFRWQSGYHDHIIRDEGAFQRIARYIRDNPKNWKGDEFFGG